LEALRAEGFIQSAAILDLDLHYGNGTASLMESRPWIKALSIYGSDYMNNIPFRDVRTPRHSDGENHRSAAIVPSEDDGAAIQCLLDEHLPWLIEGRRPDILLFQAGADPLRDDPYSPLGLDQADLLSKGPARFLVREGAGPPGGLGAGWRICSRCSKGRRGSR
jgi:acetoin utilization deacetylase AcuC-like enzyme